MLNPLMLDNWTVTSSTSPEPKLTELEARYDLAPEACPKCGTVTKFEVHARPKQTFFDTPAWGGRVQIVVGRARFKCPSCSGTFMQPLPDMAESYKMTRRCALYAAEQGIQTQYAVVARRIGVDEKTVRSLVKIYGRQALAARGIIAPVILGIDELTLLSDRRSIFTNVGEREVLDLVPDMSKKTVKRWLWSLPHKDRVQIVTIDMWVAYREAAYETLPNATVVVDKWHIQKKATEALDKVRNRLSRAAKTKKAKTEALRGRRLLMKRNRKLSVKAAFVLDGWLSNTPVLKAAYWAKEGFYDIWEAKDRDEAEARFEAWALSFDPLLVPEFLDTINTVRAWWKEIFRYFEARFTNAYTEAANGLIKAANRAGRGYAFENIRAKAILREVIYPLDLFVCESCLGQFHNSQRSQAVFYPVKHAGLSVAEMPPGSGRPHDLCVPCAERTHRFAVPFLGAPPTGKSG